MFAGHLRAPFERLLAKSRKQVTSGGATTGPSMERYRLGAIACAAGLSVAFHFLIATLLHTATPLATLFIGICLACDVAVVFGRYVNALTDTQFLYTARGLVVLHAIALCGYELTLAGATVSQFSLVALQALAVSVGIPMAWRVALGLTIATCLIQPLGAHLAVYLGVVPAEPGDLAHSWLGAAMTLALSLGVYGAVHRFPTDTKRTAGGYELTRRIATGGMGEVWEAKHNALACPAAVKIIPVTQDEASVARFQREARATALLTSIHTVKLYDFGVMNDGRPYYAMEMLNGFDLQRVVDGAGPLPPARVVSLMMQVCDSLTEAHAAGLVHRDLKPQNLFITHLGRQFDVVKVLDFGLVSIRRSVRKAGLLSSLTGTGRIAGTPDYFPPEVVAGKSPDSRSDIYQLGCVMFFLLTGEMVFGGTSAMASLLRHATETPRRPSELAGSTIPKDLDDLVMRCLAKDPAARPQSARALLRQLHVLSSAGSWTQKDARKWWAETAVFPEPTREAAARRLRS